MAEKRYWKSMIGYVAGSFALIAAIFLAWIGPKRYFEWQEDRREDKAVVSFREDIQFLDVASLDLVGRMKLLSESEYIDWMGYDYWVPDTEIRVKEIRENVQLWMECRLLPEWTLQIVEEGNLEYARAYALVINNNVILPLRLFLFRDRFREGAAAMTVVMDAEKDIMYYASASGEDIETYIANLLGFSSVETLDEMFSERELETMEELQKLVLAEGDASLREEMADCDFAAVCGAASARVRSSDLGLALDADLLFDNFTGYAGRRILESTFPGGGMAVSIGLPADGWYVSMLLEEEGITEYVSSLAEMTGLWEGEGEDALERSN